MSLFDTALDRSIVFGYTNIGYALRRSRWDGGDPRPGSLAGRTVVVTGATSGIGAAIAEQVAGLGLLDIKAIFGETVSVG